jgi:hypothetical protein
MEFALTIGGLVLGLPLELLVVGAMLQGGYRRFPAVFAYVVAQFLTTCIEMPLALAYYHSHDRHTGVRFVNWYWRDETVLQFLVLAVVISLIWEAASAARSRRAIRGGLLAGVVGFAGISLIVHFDSKVPIGRWMTFWTRDLNFGAAILDMLLWAMLIAKRQKDSRVLMLSAGLGIMFAGDAIGESVRSLGRSASAINLGGSIFVMLTNLAFFYIWWQTFRAPRAVLVSSTQ